MRWRGRLSRRCRGPRRADETLPRTGRVRQVELVTFHQSFSYEEFIEGLRPDTDGSNEGGAVQSKGTERPLRAYRRPSAKAREERRRKDLGGGPENIQDVAGTVERSAQQLGVRGFSRAGLRALRLQRRRLEQIHGLPARMAFCPS